MSGCRKDGKKCKKRTNVCGIRKLKAVSEQPRDAVKKRMRWHGGVAADG
jgi:hypothetical protein